MSNTRNRFLSIIGAIGFGFLFVGVLLFFMSGSAQAARTGEGLEVLRRALAGLLRDFAPVGRGEDGILVNARHAAALRRGLEALVRGRAAVENGSSLDMLAADIREALSALGEITGETVTEEILDRIFSTFCIGK